MSAIAVALLVVLISRAADPPSPAPAAAAPKPPPSAVERLKPKVLAAYPHDPAAYTQGLVWHAGALYESTGTYGASSLRQVKLDTGEVLRSRALPPQVFAEGLALAGERLIQLTWQEQRALVWTPATFEQVAEHRYEGEGWGLCFDGRRLVMSDGSDRLTFRDPGSFAKTGEVRIRLGGRPIHDLNELECAEGAVWANVYTTDEIVRIDPASGEVTAVVNAAGLLTPTERSLGAEVLNGIAWVPERRTFLLTGKYWPKLFEVVFEPVG